jgi:hypothetical protein
MNEPVHSALFICRQRTEEARARAAAAELEDGRLRTAQIFVECKPDEFWPGFAGWLADNFPIYLEFERRALALWKAGRTHYGHRSLWEVVRYETALRERDGEFKLNDHFTKSAAKLFCMMNPACDGMFEFRQSMGDR